MRRTSNAGISGSRLLSAALTSPCHVHAGRQRAPASQRHAILGPGRRRTSTRCRRPCERTGHTWRAQQLHPPRHSFDVGRPEALLYLDAVQPWRTFEHPPLLCRKAVRKAAQRTLVELAVVLLVELAIMLALLFTFAGLALLLLLRAYTRNRQAHGAQRNMSDSACTERTRPRERQPNGGGGGKPTTPQARGHFSPFHQHLLASPHSGPMGAWRSKHSRLLTTRARKRSLKRHTVAWSHLCTCGTSQRPLVWQRLTQMGGPGRQGHEMLQDRTT